MKKFITFVSLQRNIGEAGLSNYRYQPVGNSLLQMDKDTSYPIVSVINGYADKGETIKVYAVISNPDYTQENYKVLCSQVDEVCKSKGVECAGGVEKIIIPSGQTVDEHIAAFLKMIDYFEDDDEIFACLTFGTKVNSIAMMMAVQYAYRIKKNASIGCLVYGEINRAATPVSARIYDVTALIQMDEIVRMLADRRIQNPKKFLRMITSDEEEPNG